MKNKSCLSDAQTASVNTPYYGKSALTSSFAVPSTMPPTTIIPGLPPLIPIESTRSLPCLPTGENYSSSKQILYASQPSLDGHATVTSNNATERVQLLLSTSMDHLDKSDASEVLCDTNVDDIERSSESNFIIIIICNAFIIDPLDDTNFESNYENIELEDPYDSIPAEELYVSIKELK